jgi:hypothetical protein
VPTIQRNTAGARIRLEVTGSREEIITNAYSLYYASDINHWNTIRHRELSSCCKLSSHLLDSTWQLLESPLPVFHPTSASDTSRTRTRHWAELAEQCRPTIDTSLFLLSNSSPVGGRATFNDKLSIRKLNSGGCVSAFFCSMLL